MPYFPVEDERCVLFISEQPVGGFCSISSWWITEEVSYNVFENILFFPSIMEIVLYLLLCPFTSIFRSFATIILPYHCLIFQVFKVFLTYYISKHNYKV